MMSENQNIQEKDYAGTADIWRNDLCISITGEGKIIRLYLEQML